MNYARVINMLNLWITPSMWGDKALYEEIKAVLSKLSNSSCQLTDRELFLTQELTNGLLEATLSSFNTADYFQIDEFASVLSETTKFQSFLVTDIKSH